MKGNLSTYNRLALNILRSKLTRRSLISFVTFFVTLRCNHKCIMCDVWKNKESTEMSLEEIKNIFGQLDRLDAVRLTGGEPFLHKDFTEIIRIIQMNSNPSIIHITTNGSLTETIHNTFLHVNNLSKIHLKISIDALRDNHDRIRGVVGAWKNAIDTLSMLVEFKKNGLFVAVNQTVADGYSIKDRDRLRQICNEFNIPLLTQIAYNDSVLYKSEGNTSALPEKKGSFNSFYNFETKELLSLLDSLRRESRLIPRISERIVKNYYVRGLANRLLHNRAQPNPSCVELSNHLRILPNGQVPICLYDSTIVGDLTKQNFQELFNSQQVKQAKQKIKKCKGCWAECETVPNGIYTGDIIKGLIY